MSRTPGLRALGLGSGTAVQSRLLGRVGTGSRAPTADRCRQPPPRLQCKRSQLRFELDFRHEAANAARLAQCLQGRRDVAVPRLHPQLCTSRVLVMEFVTGCRIT